MGFTLVSLFGQRYSTKVFSFFGDGIAKVGHGDKFDFVELTNDVRDATLSQITLCLSNFHEKEQANRGLFQLFTEDGTPWFYPYFSILSSEGEGNVRLWLDIEGEYLNLGAVGPLRLLAWYHSCLAIDFSSGRTSVVVNGVTLTADRQIDSFKNAKDKLPKSVKSKFLLGKVFIPDKNYFSQYLWKITNVNLYKTKLDVETMITLTKQPCKQSGSYLSWPQMTWKLHGAVKEIEIPEPEFCQEEETAIRISIPAQYKFGEAVRTCDSLGHGRIPFFHNLTELESFHAWNRGTEEICPELWTPITDQLNENQFLNIYDNSAVSYLPFIKGQPNGGSSQNCVNMIMSQSPTPYNDAQCDIKSCVVCEQSSRRLLRLRGLCPDTNLDTIFVPLNSGDGAGDLQYSGWRRTDIRCFVLIALSFFTTVSTVGRMM